MWTVSWEEGSLMGRRKEADRGSLPGETRWWVHWMGDRRMGNRRKWTGMRSKLEKERANSLMAGSGNEARHVNKCDL